MSSFEPAELDRLREIAALRLGEDVQDEQLEAVVKRAAQELDLPIAAVSIVLDQAQYMVATHGLDSSWIERARGTPREWSFCRHAVDRRAPFIVEDAAEVAELAENPLVHNDNVRTYLGVPLITSRDQAIGALCVIGSQRRTFTMHEVGQLVSLADELLPLLEARRAE